MAVTLFNFPTSVTFDEQAANAGAQDLVPGDILVLGTSVQNLTMTMSISGLLAEDRVFLPTSPSATTPLYNQFGNLLWSGIDIGNISGGVGNTFTIAVSTGIPMSIMADLLLEALLYQNVSDTPTLNRTLTITISGLSALPDIFQLPVTVTPANDAPVITSGSAFTTPENTTPFIFTASATDPDATKPVLSLGGADAALFSIDGLNRVRFIAAPDYERPRDANGDNVYDLIVNANDGIVTTSKAVTVTVTDQRGIPLQSNMLTVNLAENAANAAPQPFTAGLVLNASSLANARFSVAGLLAEDRVSVQNQGTAAGQIGFDGTTVSFGGTAIGTVTGGAGSTLTVQFNAAANQAAAQAMLLALTYANVSDTPTAQRDLVFDIEGGSGIKLLDATNTPVSTARIMVAAEDDAPRITSAAAVGFAENGTGIAYQALGFDPDGQVVTWSLGGADAALFGINAATGAVKFLATPNFEAPQDAGANNVYDIVVTATAGGVNTGRAVAITVTDQLETATLALPGGPVVFSEQVVNLAPQRIMPDAVLQARDSLAGGKVVIGGLLAEDRVTLLHDGDGAGQIGFDGITVRFGGITIGTASGGVGLPFTVALNGAATGEAVQALLRQVAYADVSEAPTALRTLHVEVLDAAGARANAPAVPSFAAFAAAPLPALDVGAISRPTFADLDGDGLADLIVGGNTGAFRVWHNTGHGFAELTGAQNPLQGLSVGTTSAPVFADITGDGRLDLISGAQDGTFYVWSGSASGFAPLTGSDNPYFGLDVGTLSTPAIADLNGDGRLDLVSGTSLSGLRAWLNTAGGLVPWNDASNPLVTIVGANSGVAPSFVDLNGDGRLDFVAGDIADTIRTVALGTASGFQAVADVANPFSGQLFSGRASPAFGDLDGDGLLDAVVGMSNGTLAALRNVTPTGATLTVGVAAVDDAPVGPDSITLAAVNEDTPFVLTRAALLAGWSDPEGAALAITNLQIISAGGGSVKKRANGDYDVTPAANDASGIVLAYKVTDGSNAVATTATLDLLAVNDAPVGILQLGVAGGTTLTASVAFTDADGMGTPSIRWQAFGAGAWADILGEVGPATVPLGATLGVPLRAIASYVDGGGTAEQAVSVSALFGSAAAESLAGGVGPELIFGAAGKDTLDGGPGSDTLIGGKGADLLTGGDGADAFRFLTRTDGLDVITDFTPGLDRLEFMASAFPFAVGALPVARFVAGTVPTLARPQFLYDTATGTLSFDSDGTGATAPIQLAVLTGAPTLTASDILFVA